jgi:segregation and condensation protein B
MNPNEAKGIIEALLFVANSPLSLKEISQVIEIEPKIIRNLIKKLQVELEEEGRGLNIIEVAGGYQLCTKPKFALWIRKFLGNQPKVKLSSQALEVLAIIAYHQPISKVELEKIRGVNCTSVLKMLLEKKLIKIIGRKEAPGRPLLYTTTKAFLECFGLSKLSDLPNINEVQEILKGENK